MKQENKIEPLEATEAKEKYIEQLQKENETLKAQFAELQAERGGMPI